MFDNLFVSRMQLLWFLSVVSLLLSATTAAVKQNSKPNIIFILADDLVSSLN